MAVSHPQLYQQILTDRGLDSKPCLHKLFEAEVQRSPNATALIFESNSLTFEELNNRANRLGHLLRKRGVGRDALVGVFMERSPEMIIAMLAVLKAGGAYVPIDPSYPSERVSFVLHDTQLTVLLTQAMLVNKIPAKIHQIIHVDRDATELARETAEDLDSDVDGENLAYVIYTSGSTGKPKGVMIPHRAVCNYLSWMLEAFPLNGADKFLQKAPFTFDASVWEFYLPLLSGAPLVIARPQGERDNDYLTSLIAREGITVIQFVPSLLRLFLESRYVEVCRSLKHVFSGGEALTVDIQKLFFDRLPWARLHNLYGPTETTVYSAYWPCQPNAEQKTVPIGKPIKNTTIHLLDEDLQPTAPGAPGEIHIGGAGLARGYLNRPELTAEKFIRDPFSDELEARLYKTGDLARYMEDGNLEFLGRADQQVKIRGIRIELQEIETVLSQHPDIHNNVLVAREVAPGVKQLAAYVVPRPKSAPTISDLRSYLKQRLPDYMLPSIWVFVDSLPLSPNGKVDRRALPLPNNERPSLANAFLEPVSEIENQLKEIWEELLNISPIGTRDDFFELGGDSLLATQMLIKVQDVFNRVIPPSALIDGATIGYLASVITSPVDRKAYSCLVRLKPQGSKPPIFFVHPLGGEVFGYRAVASYLSKDQPFLGLRARGLDGLVKPLNDLPAIAAGYVNEILQVQSQGPFNIGGYSSGGIIAFEIAQQLQRQGHQVGFLAILDEEAPKPEGRRGWDPGFAIRLLRDLPYWFVDHVAKRPGKDVIADIQRHLRRIAKSIFKKAFKSNGHQVFQNNVYDELDLTNLSEHSLRVAEAHYEALTKYKPQVYNGRITLFRTRAEALFRSHQIDKGWQKLTPEDVEIIFIAGNHMNLYEEPYSSSLAQEMEKAMNKANNSTARSGNSFSCLSTIITIIELTENNLSSLIG